MSEIKRNSDVDCMLIHVSNLLKRSQVHEMPPPERSVLLACADSANKDDGYRWALGNESIRRFTGLSESEVRTCKKTLEAHGWISVEQRKRTVPGFDKDGKRIMKVIYDADIITVHPDFGQWWEEPAPRASCRSKNFKAKKTIATPVPGEGPPALHGTPPIPGEGPSCLENTTLLVVTTSNLQDLSYLQYLQEREAADATALALLTAPSTREVVIEAAPVTSPSPVAVVSVVQETVQAPLQVTLPGMEAPTAVKEAKKAPRAKRGAATTKTRVSKTVVAEDFKMDDIRTAQAIKLGHDPEVYTKHYVSKGLENSYTYKDHQKAIGDWMDSDAKQGTLRKKSNVLQSGNRGVQTNRVDRKQPGTNADVNLDVVYVPTDADLDDLLAVA